MDVKKAISEGSKIIMKNGAKDIAAGVITTVAAGAAATAAEIIKSKKK